jgi:hypothetical protein
VLIVIELKHGKIDKIVEKFLSSRRAVGIPTRSGDGSSCVRIASTRLVSPAGIRSSGKTQQRISTFYLLSDCWRQWSQSDNNRIPAGRTGR